MYASICGHQWRNVWQCNVQCATPCIFVKEACALTLMSSSNMPHFAGSTAAHQQNCSCDFQSPPCQGCVFWHPGPTTSLQNMRQCDRHLKRDSPGRRNKKHTMTAEKHVPHFLSIPIATLCNFVTVGDSITRTRGALLAGGGYQMRRMSADYYEGAVQKHVTSPFCSACDTAFSRTCALVFFFLHSLFTVMSVLDPAPVFLVRGSVCAPGIFLGQF